MNRRTPKTKAPFEVFVQNVIHKKRSSHSREKTFLFGITLLNN